MNFTQYTDKYEEQLEDAWDDLSDKERSKYQGRFIKFCDEMWRQRCDADY